MKTILLTIPLCFSFLFGVLAQDSDSVTISGLITGYDPNIHDIFVRAAIDDIVMDEQVTYMAPLNEDGNFELKVKLFYPQTIFFLFYNQHVTVFAKPNDKIRINFPAYAFSSETGDTLSEDYVVFTGDNHEMNSIIAKYVSKSQPFRAKHLSEKSEMGDHVAYKAFANVFRVEKMQFLADFIKNEKVDNALFIRWAESEIQFNHVSTLLLYDLQHKKEVIPMDWFDFIDDVPMDRLDVSMTDYRTYLNYLGAALGMRFGKTEPIASMFKSQENVVGVLIDSICANSQGLTQELLLTHRFANASTYEPSKIKFQEFLPRYFDIVKNERCRAYIKRCYGITPQPALPTNFLSKLESTQVPDSIKNVMPIIIEKHRGKVIVVDFWATWCGPCMGELQQLYPVLIPKFKEADVVFVFLAGKSPKDTWQHTVSELKFEGEHYLLNNDQDALLKGLFQISAIPHHVLIGKNGEVVDGNFQVSETTIRAQLEK